MAFTDEELPSAVAFVEQQFGRLPSHPRVSQFLEQITAIATLMASVPKDSDLTRLTKLCGMLGFMFYVYIARGKLLLAQCRARQINDDVAAAGIPDIAQRSLKELRLS